MQKLEMLLKIVLLVTEIIDRWFPTISATFGLLFQYLF